MHLRRFFPPALTAVAALLLTCGLAVAQTTQPSEASRQVLRDDLDVGISRELAMRLWNRLEAFRAQHQCPGMTMGFVLPDGRGGAIGVGVSNEASGRRMLPSDRMFSGSIGKTYVAAVVLQLIEEGRLDLDTKISRWLGDEPWFNRLPNAKDLTLRMVMTHTTGIPRYILVPEFAAKVKEDPRKVWTPEERLTFVFDKEPLFEAGKGWVYADTNYIIAGMIIERVTKRAYYAELERRILQPLGLDDTSPADKPKLRGLVSGYTSEPNLFSLPREVAHDETYGINPQLEWTGGGLISTSRDLAEWASLLYGGRVFNAKTRTCMLDAVKTTQGPDKLYGIGVMIRDSTHGRVLGHAGWVPGYVSMMAYYEDSKLAIAVQTNTDIGMNLGIFEGLIDELAAIVLHERGVTTSAPAIPRPATPTPAAG